MQQAYLIPGVTLYDRVRNLQHGATLIGDIGERIVAAVCRASASTFEAEQLAPDLAYAGGHIEVKTFKTTTRCLIHKQQLERYREQNCTVWYAFVSYSHRNPVPKRATKMDIINNVLTTLKHVYIMDIKTVLHAATLTESGIGHRLARLMFHGREPITRDYLTISIAGVERLAREYSPHPIETFKRKVRLSYEDYPFTTPYFTVTKTVEPIPF